MREKILSLAIILVLGLSACTSIGPSTVPRDRFDYVNAISDSWKAQMLFNLVKLRYGDAPVFLDISSVITQYGYQASLGVSGSWFQHPVSAAQNVFATGNYGEKPTITYSPLSGEKFARNLMTPIQPAAILNFLQAGYPADVVLRLCVHTINGLRSRYGGSARMRDADPDFYQLIRKLNAIQAAGGIGLRVKKTGDQSSSVIVFAKDFTPEVEADRADVRKLLGLDPKANEFSVVYGSIAANDKEIAILTRSMMEILTDLASYIEVPSADVEQRRTYAAPPPELAGGAPVAPLIRISSSPQRPDDAFAAVPYRQAWYWIDDRDFASKRLFSFIMFLFTLNDTDTKQNAPIITIPAG